MKLLIDGKYVEVGFWSLVKCILLVHLALFGIMILIGGVLSMFGA